MYQLTTPARRPRAVGSSHSDSAIHAAAMTSLNSHDAPTALALSTDAQLIFTRTDAGRTEWIFLNFELRATEDKGLGAFALARHETGERIFSERPLAMLVVPDRERVKRGEGVDMINHVVASLNTWRAAAYNSLSQEVRHGAKESPVGIWMSNAYPMGSIAGGGDRQGVFEQICRINHACNPNVAVTWNSSRRRQTVHALRRIEPGEELTVSFFGSDGRDGMVRHARQEHFIEKFAFSCGCDLCKLTGEPLARSESRQRRLMAIRESMEASPRAPYTRLKKLTLEAMALLHEEGLPRTWAQRWMIRLVSSAADAGKADAAGDWARQAAACAKDACGVDSDEYLSIAQ